MTKDEIGQRDGHERTLHQTPRKPRRLRAFLEVRLGAIERPADGAAQRDQEDHTLQHRP